METNPWQVECVEVFSHFICPECPFLTKEKGFFQDHAEKHHPLSCALFGPKGHTVEDDTNIADSDIDEKDDRSDSPTPAKDTKTITFSDINELGYLKKLTDDKSWDQYIVEENYDSFVEFESETEAHSDPIENESEPEEETKEVSVLKNHKIDFSNRKHLDHQKVQTHDNAELECNNDLIRHFSSVHEGEKSFACSIYTESFSDKTI
jgi:hypothetical protein